MANGDRRALAGDAFQVIPIGLFGISKFSKSGGGEKYPKCLQPLTPLTKPRNYIQSMKSKASSKQATKPYSVSHEGMSRTCIDAIERNCKSRMLELIRLLPYGERGE